jgi:hypothetical protein
MLNVAQVAKSMGVSHLIQTSFLSAGLPDDDSFFTESSPDPSVQSAALKGENQASNLLQDSKVRHTILRFGELYSGDAVWMQMLAQVTKKIC